MIYDYDIAVVGSGVVGTTLALAVAKNSDLKVALLESKPTSKEFEVAGSYTKRVSAISHASMNIFKNLNCWQSIKSKRFSPYQKMHVWDFESSCKIEFDAKSVSKPNLGYIIEDAVIRKSLIDELMQHDNVDYICPEEVLSFEEKTDYISLQLKSGKSISAKLLVAADGANSKLRKLSKIEMQSYDYNHSAIVFNVKTERPHEKTAWQCFLKSGPIAFLPLADENLSSIVWSCLPAEAESLLNLTDEEFLSKLNNSFNNPLGHVVEVSARQSFPLKMRHVKNYVKNHIALVGDAAHTIHPLAGQGVNLGLLDAAALSEVIIDAYEKGRDFSAFYTLRRYERSRKMDNVLMLKGVEIIKKLFTTEKNSIKQIRNASVNFSNNLPLIKNYFSSYALGNRSGMPKLALGINNNRR